MCIYIYATGSFSILSSQVKWNVFKIYLRNVGLFYCILILILYPLTNVAQFGTSLWLADWSEDAKNQGNLTAAILNNPEILRNLSAYPELQKDLDAVFTQRNYRLAVYGALGFIHGKAGCHHYRLNLSVDFLFHLLYFSSLCCAAS